jgi:glycosyltransferase involved in cell wall biosynthesis
VVDLAVAQRGLGHTVMVATSGDVDAEFRTDRALVEELLRAGVSHCGIGDFFHRELTTLRESAAALARVLAQLQAPRVVHAHTAMAGAVASWAGADAIGITCHGWSPARDPAHGVMDALAYYQAGFVTSPSRYWAHQVERQFGLRRVDVIPYGLDATRLPDVAEVLARRDAPRVVFVGEVSARKGVDVLLDAMREVWNTWPEVELAVFGGGPMAEEARLRCARPDQTTWSAHLPRPWDHIRATDVLCLPSRSDNLPLALMEASACGVACVATTVGGIPEILGPGPLAALVDPESPGATAAALLRLLACPAAAQPTAARRVAASARRRYDPARQAARLLEIYRGALARGPVRRDRLRAQRRPGASARAGMPSEAGCR